MAPALKHGIFFWLFLLVGASWLPEIRLHAQDAGADTPLSIERTSARISFETIALPPAQSRVVSIKELYLKESSGENAGYQVIVEGNVAQFSVWLGKRELSGNPVRFKELPAGGYAFTVRQEDYRSLDFNLKVRDGFQYIVTIELLPRTGAMLVSADREIESLEIDGDPAPSNETITLARGQHRVKARCFGWQDYNQIINVNEDMRTVVDIHFVRARFDIQSLSSSRGTFRPANPGRLGTTTLSFEVNAPGTGRLMITDHAGKTVLTYDFPEFSTWQQEFTWDGRDGSGTLLDEGDFLWTVAATPLSGVPGEAQERSAKVAIDNSSFIKFRSGSGVSPGIGLAGDAYTLAQGSFQTQIRFGWIPPAQSSGNQDTLRFDLGFSLGLFKNLQISLMATGSAYLATGGLATALAGIRMNWAALPLPAEPAQPRADFGLAMEVGGALPASVSSPFPYRAWSAGLVPGGHAGLAGQMRIGPFSLVIEPLVYLSPWPPVLAAGGSGSANQALPSPTATFFGSLGASAYLDWDFIVIGLSAAMRTDQTFTPVLPVPLALTLQLMPADGFVLALEASEDLGTAILGPPAIALTVGLVE